MQQQRSDYSESDIRAFVNRDVTADTLDATQTAVLRDLGLDPQNMGRDTLPKAIDLASDKLAEWNPHLKGNVAAKAGSDTGDTGGVEIRQIPKDELERFLGSNRSRVT